MALTANALRELIHYDPETGASTWRIGRPFATVQAAAAAFESAGGIA